MKRNRWLRDYKLIIPTQKGHLIGSGGMDVTQRDLKRGKQSENSGVFRTICVSYPHVYERESV